MTDLFNFELRTMPGLWRWYEQNGMELAFRAQSADEAEAWQKTLREVILRLLGGPGETCELDVQTIESVPEEGFRRELVVIQTQPGEYMPCYVLIPYTGTAPYKTVLALHGHGTWGARSLIGITRSPVEAEYLRRHNADYARQMVLQGYLVFAPVLRGFAERVEDEQREPFLDVSGTDMWVSSCRAVSLNAMLRGKTLIGWRVWDVMRLIDYVRTRSDAASATLGCIGLSGGGTLTLYAAALDTRITCAYISGCLNTFRDSIMSIEHCLCNYVPGILQYAEMADIAGLIAPRPLFVENGRHDPIYPVAGLQKALRVLERIYGCFDASDYLASHVFEGEHRWDGQYTAAWLKQWL